MNADKHGWIVGLGASVLFALNNSFAKAITEEPYRLHLVEDEVIQSADERR